MSSPRVTDAKLQRAREEREYWKLKHEASSLKSEVESLNPDMLEGAQSAKRGTSLGQRLKETYTDALEVKTFKDIVEGNTPRAPATTYDVAGAKARIIEALAKSGKTPDEISNYMDRIASHLDVYALSSDPAVQSILFNRVMSGNQQNLGVKDILELVSMVNQNNQTRNPQQNVTELVAAMGSMFQSGVQAASKNNSDPMQAFDSAVKFITPIMQQQTETVKASFENQLNMLKTEIQQRDPSEFFRRMKEMAGNFGWGPPVKESPEVTARRIDLEDKNEQRNFEWNRLKYETDMKMKEEAAKDKRQSELLGTITSTLSKTFESPVISQLGKNLGARLGTKNPLTPLSEARVQAAEQQLQNPLDTLYGFRCPKCGKDTKFTSLQLTKISSAGGRWVCSCGEPYSLAGEDKRGQAGP